MRSFLSPGTSGSATLDFAFLFSCEEFLAQEADCLRPFLIYKFFSLAIHHDFAVAHSLKGDCGRFIGGWCRLSICV
jgi:hypothetical protein